MKTHFYWFHTPVYYVLPFIKLSFFPPESQPPEGSSEWSVCLDVGFWHWTAMMTFAYQPRA